MKLSTFRTDVTPPLGHPLCGGWITPAAEIVDRQWANGAVLLLEDGPAALVTLDWCEIRNAGWDEWRQAIAGAVGTTPERVFVHCVHPHDAPFADPEAERLLREAGAAGSSLDLEFFERAKRDVAAAARASVSGAEPLTHLGTGAAQVDSVASNRRIAGAEGKVGAMRGSSCKDPALREEPEGLIDPLLRSVTFWQGERLLAGLHYYATHPMSHYGQGGVSCDFCGVARDELAGETGAPQLYFTGGAGNIGAGKYNDGSAEMRPVLKERVLAGMRVALAETTREPLRHASWHSLPVKLPSREEFTEQGYDDFLQTGGGHLERYRGATGLSWLRHRARGNGIDFSCVSLNEARLLQLPGEPFVEYQFFAQAARRDRFVCLAGYGDCGPGYLPTAAAYVEGGYESGWAALVAPESEAVIQAAIRELLQSAG